MQIVATGSGPVHQAPFPSGPAAEILIDERPGTGRLAAAHVVLPPGGGMPEHEHGESEALVVPLTGELVIVSGDQQEKVAPGVVVLLARGERVRLANDTSAPVSLLAVFAPASFVRALSSWPAAA